MNGLPEELPRDGAEAFTGLVCPECSGSVTVRRQDRHVTLACRVGHAYSVAELVTGKEAALEEDMWRAVYAFEELDALLADLQPHRLTDGFGSEACRKRCALARRQAMLLRSIIEADSTLAEHAEDSASGGRPVALP